MLRFGSDFETSRVFNFLCKEAGGSIGGKRFLDPVFVNFGIFLAQLFFCIGGLLRASELSSDV